ncbi:hypothetical protein Metbo_1324 [Methanobacterium lacus]|uniref:Uncharacterized protein n=1 Tax=Methanobacterium lacus (strain AL-21) TaxID=877455 RepID=F0T7J8_METLA|nr:hypothetical protein [Methanobacterium lacus]ADZ09566.1 hypothetical protein Metbo_1324 [Methanobacterium lacus]
MDNKKRNELKIKCESMKDDPSLMKECTVFLKTMEDKKVGMKDDSGQNYTNMVENISAEDVPKVLEMALKIARSDEIDDPELKNAAERLIRTLEPL